MEWPLLAILLAAALPELLAGAVVLGSPGLSRPMAVACLRFTMLATQSKNVCHCLQMLGPNADAKSKTFGSWQLH
jgi:hypothetical protein